MFLVGMVLGCLGEYGAFSRCDIGAGAGAGAGAAGLDASAGLDAGADVDGLAGVGEGPQLHSRELRLHAMQQIRMAGRGAPSCPRPR